MFILYYRYIEIEDAEGACAEQISICERLALRGRIRISVEGINGTLCGEEGNLQLYMRNAEETYGEIHWKTSGFLASKPPDEQSFSGLSVKVTKEVVSLDLNAEEEHIVKATPGGVHLSPEAFHAELQSAEEGNVVLIDVRNIYETRIGGFLIPGGKVGTIDPKTRKFSEFVRSMDSYIPEIKGKKIMMYCTGGVRCERASSYLRSKGIENVYQLSGGIHAYQQKFPAGGFFRGKNFVYDPRIALPYPECDETIGRCSMCSDLYDDYSRQCRCRSCRMLILICNKCSSSRDSTSSTLCEKCNTVVDHQKFLKAELDHNL